MEFLPLRYAWNSVTIWHALILAMLVAPNVWRTVSATQLGQPFSESASGLAISLAAIVWLYFLAAPILGQVFGERFTFAMVWPSSVVLGVSISAGFMGYVAFGERESINAETGGELIFAFFFFAVFWSAALNLFLWLMPRMVGWGVVELPKYPWGVKL